MSKIVPEATGRCARCTRPWDDHCLKCEPVPLCPYSDRDGYFHTPCARIGPASKEVTK